MSKRTPLPPSLPVARAAKGLAALVKRLGEAPDGRLALTVRGEVKAWLVLEPEESTDDEPTRKVRRLVKRALKAARE
jgi:hypothetical protein